MSRAFLLVFSMLYGQAQAQIADPDSCAGNLKTLATTRENYVEMPREGKAAEREEVEDLIAKSRNKGENFDSSDNAFSEIEALKQRLHDKQNFVLSSGDPNLETEYYSAFVDIEYFLRFKRDQKENRGLLSRIRRWSKETRLLGSKGVKEKRNETLSRQLGGDLDLLRSRKRGSFRNDKTIQDELQHFFFLRYMQGDPRSLEILDWMARKSDFEFPKAWREFRDLTAYMDRRFEKDQKLLKDSLTKKKIKALKRESREAYLDQYNKMLDIKIKEAMRFEDFQRHVAQYVHAYGSVDENFRTREFFQWLTENGEPSPSTFRSLKKRALKNDNVSIASYVKSRYEKFAPYSKQDIYADKKFIEAWKARVKASFGKLKKEWTDCRTSKCQLQIFQRRFMQLFDGQFYRDKFSCMIKNPIVMKSGAMDIAVYWGALFAYYNANKDTLDRFPFEAIASSIVFTPIFSEANCRISFKSDLSFGKAITKADVWPNGTTKAKRFVRKQVGLVGKTALSTVTFVGFTHSFDQIFLALGGKLAYTPNLVHSLQTVPFIFLHGAVWGNARRALVQNPIRYKLLPKLTQKISQKIKMPGANGVLGAGADFGVYFLMSRFNSWEYFTLYRGYVMPYLMGLFGLNAVSHLDDEGLDDEEVRKLNESVRERFNLLMPDVALPQSSISFEEDDTSLTVVRKLSNGVESKATVEKLEDGTVRLKSVDLEVPDEVMDQLVDAIVAEHQDLDGQELISEGSE